MQCFKYTKSINFLLSMLHLSTSPISFLLTFRKYWAPSTSQISTINSSSMKSSLTSPSWTATFSELPNSQPFLSLTIHFSTYLYTILHQYFKCFSSPIKLIIWRDSKWCLISRVLSHWRSDLIRKITKNRVLSFGFAQELSPKHLFCSVMCSWYSTDCQTIS